MSDPREEQPRSVGTIGVGAFHATVVIREADSEMEPDNGIRN